MRRRRRYTSTLIRSYGLLTRPSSWNSFKLHNLLPRFSVLGTGQEIRFRRRGGGLSVVLPHKREPRAPEVQSAQTAKRVRAASASYAEDAINARLIKCSGPQVCKPRQGWSGEICNRINHLDMSITALADTRQKAGDRRLENVVLSPLGPRVFTRGPSTESLPMPMLPAPSERIAAAPFRPELCAESGCCPGGIPRD